MNWTGGGRARSGKPSSGTARIQKSYFAKVRAKNSTPLAHAALSLAFSGDGTSVSGGRKKARVPELDIILTQESQKKRKTSDTFHDLTPFEELVEGVDNHPGGNRTRMSSDIKMKKQRLLEKDSWVCTTLARPLVLKRKQVAVDVRPQERTTPEILRNPELFLDPIDQEGIGDGPKSVPKGLNYARYPSLERRSVECIGNEHRGFNGGVFRNLSDGGFVQIGGESTQFGGSDSGQRGLSGREMSDISEETMLLDIEGRQEENSPPTFLKGSNMFSKKHGVGGFARPPGDTRFNLNDWSVNRDTQMHGGYPSSPLAPYSQVPREWGLSPPAPISKFVPTGQGKRRDIIEEIDEVATEIWTSSPSEVLPAKPIQSQVMLPRPTQITHNDNAQEITRVEEQPYREYFSGDIHTHKSNNLLGRLIQEDVQHTQNESLIAYASSGSSSAGEDEGEEWMLGSNISPGSSQGSKAIDTRSTGEAQDGWELFLKDHIVNEEDIANKHQEPQEHPTESNAVEKHTGRENIAEISNERDGNVKENQSQDFIRGLNLEYGEASGVLLGGEPVKAPPLVSDRDKDENWREFLRSSQTQSGDNDTCTEVKEIVDQEVAKEGPDTVLDEKKEPERTLEFDKDEDNAWRAFVFAGLDDDEVEPELEPPKSPEPIRRRTTMPLKPALKPPKVILPSSSDLEPELPANCSPKENIYAPSMAGATVGSGSGPSSEGTSSEAGSSPIIAQRTSKFFSSRHDIASSPPAVSVGAPPLRPGSMLPVSWRGQGNLCSTSQKKLSKRKRGVQEDLMEPPGEKRAAEGGIEGAGDR